MNPPIQVGLCAYGMSGHVFHAPLLHIHNGFHIHSILERSSNRSTDRYPYVSVIKQLDELMQKPEIELIVVNTPEETHYEFAVRALEANKHVVVEKAFTVTSKQATELIRLAEEKNLLLSVFQNRRWDADFLTVRKVIENKWLGRIVEYEAHYDRYRNYIKEGSWKEENRPGTGILYNLGSHLIDQALVLFGKPKAVFADVRIIRTNGEVPDMFELILAYPEVKVSLKASYLVRRKSPKFLVYGTLGSFVKYGEDPQEAALKQGRYPNEATWGEESQENYGLINTDIDGLHVQGTVESIPGSYLSYYDNIFDAIRSGEALAVKAEEALWTIQVIEAAYRSVEEKTYIDL